MANTRVLIDTYKRDLSKYSRRLALLREKDSYFERLHIKRSTNLVKTKRCPFHL